MKPEFACLIQAKTARSGQRERDLHAAFAGSFTGRAAAQGDRRFSRAGSTKMCVKCGTWPLGSNSRMMQHFTDLTGVLSSSVGGGGGAAAVTGGGDDLVISNGGLARCSSVSAALYNASASYTTTSSAPTAVASQQQQRSAPLSNGAASGAFSSLGCLALFGAGGSRPSLSQRSQYAAAGEAADGAGHNPFMVIGGHAI